MTTPEILAYVPLVVVTGGGLIAWGSLHADVRNIEQDVETLKKDHDILVRVDERVQAILERLEEKK